MSDHKIIFQIKYIDCDSDGLKGWVKKPKWYLHMSEGHGFYAEKDGDEYHRDIDDVFKIKDAKDGDLYKIVNNELVLWEQEGIKL